MRDEDDLHETAITLGVVALVVVGIFVLAAAAAVLFPVQFFLWRLG